VFPPIDVLRSLSRLMNNGIGKDRTREDHRELSNQLYSSYAKGQETRRLVAIVGEDALSELDRKYLRFAEEFERTLVHQGGDERSMEETLNLGWKILGGIPENELRRIRREFIQRYRPKAAEGPAAGAPAAGAQAAGTPAAGAPAGAAGGSGEPSAASPKA
jgi:V/A-type H+-transporting ATPase subunit B